MTMGYPGTTSRYLSSYGVEERMNADNMARIDVRAIKQAIWKDAMEKSDAVRIKYASKYAQSANYWKNSIGMNQSIKNAEYYREKTSVGTSTDGMDSSEAGRTKQVCRDIDGVGRQLSQSL